MPKTSCPLPSLPSRRGVRFSMVFEQNRWIKEGFEAGLLPDAPHDPMERACVYRHRGWEIRTFAWNSQKHRFFAGQGMLHLQLWAPIADVSILTPSRLTDGMYDLWVSGRRIRLGCFRGVSAMTLKNAGVRPPSRRVICQYESALVHAASIGAGVRRASK